MGQVISFLQDRNTEYAFPKEFFGSVKDLIDYTHPQLPVYVFNPKHLHEAARNFLTHFKGTSLYALKTNPTQQVVCELWNAGITNFDVASLNEIKIVHSLLPKASMHFMHPVKSREAIHASYFQYGVKTFVVDHEHELIKILEETHYARDLNLFVRLALPKNNSAEIDFSNKFGAKPNEAQALLQQARKHCVKLGLSFHVGTQTLNANVYASAINLAATVIKNSDVDVDVLNIGGGFAVSYPGQPAPDLKGIFQIVDEAIQKNNLSSLELIAEPGRALVAESGSLITRIELRKGNLLYLNDGTYGGLFDAGPVLNERFPVQAYSKNKTLAQDETAFSFAGPTCDSLDMMNGPFLLPHDIQEGDWVEIGNLGSYSQAMRTDFNGFGLCEFTTLRA